MTAEERLAWETLSKSEQLAYHQLHYPEWPSTEIVWWQMALVLGIGLGIAWRLILFITQEDSTP